MIDKFLNVMRQQASLVNNSISSTALGTIVAYDQSQYYASVQLYPADPADHTSSPMITGMMPIFSPWVGSGWGLFSPPNIGDIVEVHFQEGSLQNGYIGLRTWNLNQLPLSVPSGEFWLVHETGSYIKLTNDGNISINGTVNLGELTSSVKKLMNEVALGVYNSHTHNVTGGLTTIPNQQLDPSTALTSNTKAN